MTTSTAGATLQAGDTETLYRRAGDGPPVLLVCSGALAEPVGGELFARLAARFRVVATSLPGGQSPIDTVETWLGELLEGLGLVRPALVVDEALAAVLLDAAVATPDSVAQVVAVIGDGGAADSDRKDARAVLLACGAVLVPLEEGEPRSVAALAAAAMTPFLSAGGASLW